MTLRACYCEVDHDCAPVSQWCEPCQAFEMNPRARELWDAARRRNWGALTEDERQHWREVAHAERERVLLALGVRP